VKTLNNWCKYKLEVLDAVLMWAVQHRRLKREIKITAKDSSNGELVELTTKLTTEHSTSKHDQPVMIIIE
jgi:hypothetical protein